MCGNRSRSWNIWQRTFPAAKLWPADAAARGHARAIAAEMHAGFAPLCRHLPMNIRRPALRRELDDQVRANVRRIEAIWTDCRKRFGIGPVPLGGFGAADAMYAPVVSRFHTYDVRVSQWPRLYAGRYGAAGLAGVASSRAR